ncbi:hypothetical protein [Paenibacillus sp. DMB5]|uniref:hypothetical protein n=1 Tax=Paenibacillus sp. DMB5 TaxID=1780103 RepID=UPI000AE60E0B|nr:hypothetical protein [Paenibacillus sp. DMB5]
MSKIKGKNALDSGPGAGKSEIKGKNALESGSLGGMSKSRAKMPLIPAQAAE